MKSWKAISILVAAALLLTACNMPAPRGLPNTGTQATPTTLIDTLLTQTVNSTQEAPAATVTPGTSDTAEVDAFTARLSLALEGKNFDQMRAMMGEQFTLAGWRSEGSAVTPDQAITQLRQLIPDGAAPKADFSRDLAPLLDGSDPLAVFGPEAVKAFFVDGLGSSGEDEGIVLIGRNATTGKLYWQGLLTAMGGFQVGNGSQPTQSSEAAATDVKYVRAIEAIFMRAGPGTQSDALGLVPMGEVVEVTGKSADGNWWQINCTASASGKCWITADPALTEPTTQP